jgi:hypothetical protein
MNMGNFFLLEFQFHHLKNNTLAKGENFLVLYYKDKLVPPFYNLIIAFGASSCSIKITTAKLNMSDREDSPQSLAEGTCEVSRRAVIL